MKHQYNHLEERTSFDLVMVIGSVCLLIPSLNMQVFLIEFTSECEVVNEFERRSPISFQHVFM